MKLAAKAAVISGDEQQIWSPFSRRPQHHPPHGGCTHADLDSSTRDDEDPS